MACHERGCRTRHYVPGSGTNAMNETRNSGGARPEVRRMSDLARIAGVSEATVSRALADSPLVNRKTKAHVRALAKAHGYVINEQARNFRLGRTRTIAVVILLDPVADQQLSDPFFAQLTAAIADALNARGFDMLLSRVDTTDAQWPDLLRDASRVDGSIVIGQWSQHDRLNALARENLPFVVWGGHLEDQRYVTVGCDNVAGAAMAVGHLLDHGRRRIAFIGDRTLPEIALRYRGYADRLKRAGLAPDESMAMDAQSVQTHARAAVEALLADGVAIDAIFAASDVLAMAAIAALGERGIRAPEDVAVIGFDDVAIAEWYNPPLTTVRQHIGQGARMLVELLIARLEGQAIAPAVLSPELVARASCGCRHYQNPITKAAVSPNRPSASSR